MARIHLLLTNMLPAILDVGVGMLLVVIVLSAFDLPITGWHLMVGAILALLPDIDIIPSILAGRSTPFDHHTSLWHRPILVIALSVALAYVLGGAPWAVIAFICLLWHFVHDTGWVDDVTGIAWLWPFSDRFVSWYGLYTPDSYPDHHEWLELSWVRPTLLSVGEITLGLAAVGLSLYWTDLHTSAWVLLPSALLVVTLIVWLTKDIVGR